MIIARISRPARFSFLTALLAFGITSAPLANPITNPNASASTLIAIQYEDYLQRKQDLIALSSIFGQLHHIRRTCEPRREANIWRQRMQTMIELEEPDEATHLDMVNRFNDGFQAMRARYPECNREAQDKGKDLAYKGSAIVQRLAGTLEPDKDGAVTNASPG